MVDPVRRRIVAEKLHTVGVQLVLVEHELYRCLRVHRGGLSRKETALVAAQLSILENARTQLHRVQERANRDAPS